MAEDEPEGRRPAGGGLGHGKVFGLPVWAVAVGGGVLLGGLFLLLRSRSAAAAAAATPTTTSTTPDATSLVPYDQSGQGGAALTDQQVATILSAISNQQGAASTPVSTTKGAPVTVSAPKGSVLLKPGTPGTYMSAPKGLTLDLLTHETGLDAATLRRLNPDLAHTPIKGGNIAQGTIIRIK